MIYHCFFIAIFSFHRAYAGLRFATVRDHANYWSDKIVTFGVMVISAMFFVIGIAGWHVDDSQQIVLLVFGVLSTMLCLNELRYYNRPLGDPKTRIAMHLRAILGGTIAVFTAVLVVNVQVPEAYEFVVFLLPTVVFVPIMIYWQRKNYAH